MGVPVVFFTRDLSSKGLKKIYDRVGSVLQGKVAVKFLEGSQNESDVMSWPDMKEFLSQNLSEASVVTSKISNDCDSIVVITDFKGSKTGGFEGANQNVGANINEYSQEDMKKYVERITQATKTVIDTYKNHICYINVIRSSPDVGILASTDILAVDSACVDLVYAMNESYNQCLVESIESNCGLGQLSYMNEMGLGSDEYVLLDIDNDDRMLFPEEAVAHIGV